MVARDIKTLCAIGPFHNFLLSSSDGLIDDHAEIVELLLTCDDASVSNDSATVIHAFNRPLPHPVPTLWMTNDLATSDLVTWRLLNREPRPSLSTIVSVKAAVGS